MRELGWIERLPDDLARSLTVSTRLSPSDDVRGGRGGRSGMLLVVAVVVAVEDGAYA